MPPKTTHCNMFVCLLLGLILASSCAFDAKWPDPDKTTGHPAFPPGMPDKFDRPKDLLQGEWGIFYKAKKLACSYPGPDLPGADCDDFAEVGIAGSRFMCGFSNLIHSIDSAPGDILTALFDPNPVGKKLRVSVQGVQAVNGLNLEIRYAHFCSKEGASLYQAAYVSPHYPAWYEAVPLQLFLNDTRFDTVGSAAERKAYVAGMRQFGLVDDGELVDMERSEDAATCHQAPYRNGPAVCSAEFPDDYSCQVTKYTPATSTGCGRSRTQPCPAQCEDQDLYHKQCQNRTCPNDDRCCAATGGAENMWYIKGPWLMMNEHLPTTYEVAV